MVTLSSFLGTNFKGPQGTQGLQGPINTQGTQGRQGIQGRQGTQGSQGRQGTQGTQGTQGSIGAAGSNVSVTQISATTRTLELSDGGKHISATDSVTVPASVFSAGDVVAIYNNSAAAITIVQGSGATMYQAGTTNTGNRSLSGRGLCLVLCVASNTFVISGQVIT